MRSAWVVMLWLAMFLTPSPARASGADWVVAKEIFPRVVFWTGTFWDEYDEVFVVWLRVDTFEDDGEELELVRPQLVNRDTYENVIPGCYQYFGN